MRYEILGPLRVVDTERASFITAHKIEVVLATLVVRADQVVAANLLKTEVWGDDPPRRATAALHVYISQLRKFLRRPDRDNPIVTLAQGYLLQSGSDEVDFHEYQARLYEGHRFMHDANYEQACGSFTRALALWRGPVLDDLHSGPIVGSFVTWLTESHLECWEQLIESQLHCGRHRELVGRLYSLIAENPFRETFYRQLMLALFRSERQADALHVYQLARKTLNDELGLEPCRALRELHQSILSRDDHLELHAAS